VPAPLADLLDTSGKKVAVHYAGPSWESEDGSKLVAEFKARNDEPVGNAISCLMRAAKSNTGNGVFRKATVHGDRS
jgi:hypothetical protein